MNMLMFMTKREDKLKSEMHSQSWNCTLTSEWSDNASLGQVCPSHLGLLENQDQNGQRGPQRKDQCGAEAAAYQNSKHQESGTHDAESESQQSTRSCRREATGDAYGQGPSCKDAEGPYAPAPEVAWSARQHCRWISWRTDVPQCGHATPVFRGYTVLGRWAQQVVCKTIIGGNGGALVLTEGEEPRTLGVRSAAWGEGPGICREKKWRWEETWE